MPSTVIDAVLSSWKAQAGYVDFPDLGIDPKARLTANGFTSTQADRLLSALSLTTSQVSIKHQTASEFNGFSATVFFDAERNRNVLAIRGTESSSLADLGQDAALTATGFAGSQAISLYRYYRQLSTPLGDRVAYTAMELDKLHRLNSPFAIPGLRLLSNAALDLSLSSDVGLGILNPNERVSVTGHSLGGHLALLFGRAFPSATESIYTFNAPGFTAAGRLLLSLAGFAPNDPAKVTNIVAAGGLDITAALGTRDGNSLRVFNEVGPLGDIAHNHSIVQLSDSLAMYEVLAKLSPGLGENINEATTLLLAASARPYASLESTLDMLSLAVANAAIETPIARTDTDAAQRESYYQALYQLRDNFADGRDWSIRSLAGLDSGALAEAAQSDPSYRYALKTLMPFAVTGGDFDGRVSEFSGLWASARGDFVQRLIEARTADRLYGLSGEPVSFRYLDTDRDEQFSVLSPRDAIVAQSQGTEARLVTYLDGVTYDHVVAFGSDDAGAPDDLEGTSGSDQLFGESGDDGLAGLDGNDVLDGGDGGDTIEGGDGDDVLLGGPGSDVLDGGSGDDVLAGGSGSDVLIGGDGFDTYALDALPVDEDSDDPEDILDPGNHYTISDSDGEGRLVAGSVQLVGGDGDPDSGVYFSDDGNHIYLFSGTPFERGTLNIDGVVEIENFLNGELGIVLGQPAPTLEDIPEHHVFNPDFGGEDLPAEGEDVAYAAGNSFLEGLGSNDVILGGPGDNVLVAGARGEDIDAAVADIAYDLFEREALGGGPGADLLIGSARGDYLEGDEGDDTIHAGAGNDIILGDGYALAKNLGGREFHSDGTVLITDPPNGITHGIFENRFRVIPLVNPLGASSGTAFSDTPGAGNDIVEAGRGNDFVLAGGGADVVHGGAGDDTIYGGPGDDQLFGEAGGDHLYGEGGDDLLDSGTGGGTPTAQGGDGNDTLRGGGLLIGGPGADRFIPRNATIHLADGDTVELDGGFGFAVAAETHAVQAVIEMHADARPDDVTVQAESSGWSLSAGTFGGMSFDGGLQDWTALTVRFADGTVWTQSELAAHVVDFVEPVGLSAGYATADADTIYGTPGSDTLSGGAGDDTYFIKAGGHDSVDAGAGDDVVHLGSVLSGDTEVFSTADDLVLRYPGGELRLVGQGLTDGGVSAVTFDRDGTTWNRAELAARASPLESLEVEPQFEQAMPGEAFDVTLAATLFDEAYTVGTASLEVVMANGTDLPSWLQFDSQTRRFSGTPQEADVGAVPLLVALRDAGAVVAIAPMVIAVGDVAAEEPPSEEPTPPAEEPVVQPPVPPTASTSAPAPADEATAPSDPVALEHEALPTETQVADLAQTRTTSSTPASTSNEPPEAVTIAAPADTRTPPTEQSVGAIEDTTYLRIDSLLSGPASTHASGFMERYSEAIQEFRRRQESPSDTTPSDPPPTDEEMAMYNAALHAWLDRDAQRMASGAAEAWDFGGMGSSYFFTGSEGDRAAAALGGQALARPSLGGAPTLQRAPGLEEGLVKLGA